MRLNHEQRIIFHAVCKGWKLIKKTANDLVHDIPLNVISTILMKLAEHTFRDFFNFYICWSKGQTERTVKVLLDQIPIQKLYHWGYKVNKPKESMFAYFMTMSQHLGNNDAEFYFASKNIILRNHIHYDNLEYSFTSIKNMSARGNMISMLFQNMLDIYFFPVKRQDAVVALINMIMTPGTKKIIIDKIMVLRSIAAEIYPETMFGPISGTPICNYSHQIEDNHYESDGYPVHPEQIDDYTCLPCKIALLFGCLSAYLTPSLHFHLNLY